MSPYIYHAGKEEKVTVHLIGLKSCEVIVTLKKDNQIVASARNEFKPGQRGLLKLRVIKTI